MVGFFTKNLGAKILALIFALSLWFYVAVGEARVDKFPGKIPIEVKNVPVGMAVSDYFEGVDLKIKAPFSTWQKLSSDSFQAFVDVNNLDVGTYRLDVNIKVSEPEVSIVEKNPSKVTVHLEEVTEKNVPINFKIEGKVADGFATGELESDPKEVKIKGAKSLVERITNATAVVGLSGEMSDTEKFVPLIIFDGSGNEIKNLEIFPSNVKVKVPISKATNIKTVGIKAAITGNPAENFWVSKIVAFPSTAVVTGEAENLKSLDFLETTKLDITNISSNLTKNVDLVLPSGISLVSNERSIKITVYVSPNTTTKSVPASFNFIGGKGSTTTVVNVIVSGPVSGLSGISAGNVVINFNVSGKSSGSAEVTRDMISLPAGFDVVDFSPKNINLVVE